MKWVPDLKFKGTSLYQAGCDESSYSDRGTQPVGTTNALIKKKSASTVDRVDCGRNTDVRWRLNVGAQAKIFLCTPRPPAVT